MCAGSGQHNWSVAEQSLRRYFPFVIVDLARGFSEINLAAMERGANLLMVCTPTSVTLRASRFCRSKARRNSTCGGALPTVRFCLSSQERSYPQPPRRMCAPASRSKTTHIFHYGGALEKKKRTRCGVERSSLHL